MDPRSCIRNGFAHGNSSHSHFYAACNSRHESSMIPKTLKIATLQKKMVPIPPHTYHHSSQFQKSADLEMIFFQVLLSSGMLAWRMNAGFDTRRIQTPTAIPELYNLWIIHEGPGRAQRQKNHSSQTCLTCMNSGVKRAHGSEYVSMYIF